MVTSKKFIVTVKHEHEHDVSSFDIKRLFNCGKFAKGNEDYVQNIYSIDVEEVGKNES